MATILPIPPISPVSNSTILAVPSVSASVALAAGTAQFYGQNHMVQVANVGTAEAFFQLGDSAVVAIAEGAVTGASDGSTSIPAGSIMVFSAGAGITHGAAITNSGTTTLRCCRGYGN